MITCNLRELMKDKSRMAGEKVTYQDIYEATGISQTTLSRLAQPTLPKLIGLSVMDRLCAFFDCSVGELFEYSSDEGGTS